MPVILDWVLQRRSRTSDVTEMFWEWYRRIMCQVFKMSPRNLYGRERCKFLRKRSWWDSFRSPHVSRACDDYNYEWLLYEKDNGSKTPEMFYMTLDCCHFDRPDPNVSWVGSGLYQRASLGPMQAADLPHNFFYKNDDRLQLEIWKGIFYFLLCTEVFAILSLTLFYHRRLSLL
jgi:hypothetical protein